MAININIGGSSKKPGKKQHDYAAIVERYEGFGLPRALVEIGGNAFTDKAGEAIISHVSVELSCGFEASMAYFRIYNAYDPMAAAYRYEDVKQFLLLGSSMAVSLGYGSTLTQVFVGFIAEVYFCMEEGDIPYIQVVGMDAKGVMMAGAYSSQLKARTYGDAVREVLERQTYKRLESEGAIVAIRVSDTPDKKGGGEGGNSLDKFSGSNSLDKTPSMPGTASGSKVSAERVEMVAESDYEFIVKAAKKFNYEFYVENGCVIFRKAKTGAVTLTELGIGKGVQRLEIGYGITGLVETVEARALDAGNGKLITASQKLASTISSGSKAKGLIKGSRRVYIDPTITSQQQADARVDSLMEEMRYRLGSLDCHCVGIPELLPGNYLDITGVGTPVSNSFYITHVVHSIDENRGYFSHLTGRAAEVKT